MNAPPVPTLLYDSHCRICVASAKRLERLMQGRVCLATFRDPDILKHFPTVTPEAAQRAIHLVTPDGRVHVGAAALVQCFQSRGFGFLFLPYYVPGIRWLSDRLYGVVARNRFRLAGRSCEDGTCHMHSEK